MEQIFNKPGRILLLDSNVFQNLAYCLKNIDWKNPNHRKYFLDISRRIQNDYEYIFFLPNHIWYYVNDNERKQRYWDALWIGQDVKNILDMFNVKYYIVKSIGFDKRIKEILKVLGVK